MALHAANRYGKVCSPRHVAARAAPARVPAGLQLPVFTAGYTRPTPSWGQRHLGSQGTARYLRLYKTGQSPQTVCSGVGNKDVCVCVWMWHGRNIKVELPPLYKHGECERLSVMMGRHDMGKGHLCPVQRFPN